MSIHKSRFGYHPCSYETFRQLKDLKKWYWETVYAEARWRRWDRKTVHQHGPEPEFCPLFVEKKGHYATFTRQDGGTRSEWRAHRLIDHGVLEAFELARMPVESPEQVPELAISAEEIATLHQKLMAWLNREESTETCDS